MLECWEQGLPIYIDEHVHVSTRHARFPSTSTAKLISFLNFNPTSHNGWREHRISGRGFLGLPQIGLSCSCDMFGAQCRFIIRMGDGSVCRVKRTLLALGTLTKMSVKVSSEDEVELSERGFHQK